MRLDKIRRTLFGDPIHSKHAHHQRLGIGVALAVFASDALSSTAYASEEILLKLERGGPEMMRWLPILAVTLIGLLWTVIFSYRQTIMAYPKGGGSYRVSSENLGQFFGLVAAAALLIGYVLTVAVSVSAGASAIRSMYPPAGNYAAFIASGAVLVITFLNLRGAKESGAVFAPPTYSFVALVALVGVVGLGSVLTGQAEVPPLGSWAPSPGYENLDGLGFVVFIFAAFAAGCTALTGTEAIADGTLAFKAPEARNASRTLILMGVVLTVLFLLVSFTAWQFNIKPMEYGPGYKTVLAQVAAAVFGDGSILFYLTQVATALILMLAANTAYADFPRLSMFVAEDGYMPRQLTSVGDRLVFQNGIITLAALSIALIVGFNADVHQLIPMYAVSVFLSFTLSQSGMVAWWKRQGKRSWKQGVSLFGAIVCGVVTLVLFFTRFTEGAWITIAALLVTMIIFYQVKAHYKQLDAQLSVDFTQGVEPTKTTTILLVPRLHQGVLQAVSYANSVGQDVRAVHVTLSPDGAEKVKEQWSQLSVDIPLVILESPYRSLVEPIIDYVRQSKAEAKDVRHTITVIVPQAVPRMWIQQLLHNNLAEQLKQALGEEEDVIITNVRYQLK
jgi:amino acid transporter